MYKGNLGCYGGVHITCRVQNTYYNKSVGKAFSFFVMVRCCFGQMLIPYAKHHMLLSVFTCKVRNTYYNKSVGKAFSFLSC